MKYGERYRKTFDTYYNISINDQETLQRIQNKQKSSTGNVARRWIIAMASIVLICSSVTMVGIAEGWGYFVDIFRNGFDDLVSADLIETGAIQELNIVNETDEYTLTLKAFTGDMETQIALFELTPKMELGEFDEIFLYAKTFYPNNWENGSYKRYEVRKVNGYKLEDDKDKNTYYFSYKLPSYWIKNISDIMIQVRYIELYSESEFVKNLKSDMLYAITPDRDILADATKLEVNEFVTKQVFNIVGFPFQDLSKELTEGLVYASDVIAPLTERTMQITDVVISKYKTEVKGLIYDEAISRENASSAWTQFTAPQLITEHYYNGSDSKTDYNMVAVDNVERIRLFVDGLEYKVDKESLHYSPGKGHDAEGKMKTEGYYGCSINFAGFDYEQASKVEIHFGDKVITLK